MAAFLARSHNADARSPQIAATLPAKLRYQRTLMWVGFETCGTKKQSRPEINEAALETSLRWREYQRPTSNHPRP
jgi:hypothetical protein